MNVISGIETTDRMYNAHKLAKKLVLAVTLKDKYISQMQKINLF